MTLTLHTPVTQLSTVGQTTGSRLKKLEIFTAEDLIFYFPFRYEDFSQIDSIESITPNSRVTIRGRIEQLKSRRGWKSKRAITEAIISDKTGSVKALWFNQPYLTKTLEVCTEVYLSGKVGIDKYDLQLVSPLYEKVKRAGDQLHTARLVPIYSTTERLTQKQLRWLIKLALNAASQVVDWLPEETIHRLALPRLADALVQIHFPDSKQQLDQAINRIKFDELFIFMLQSLMLRRELKSADAVAVEFHETKVKAFVDCLPFQLTSDQRRAAWEIIRDIAKPKPMNRLLEGDVGAGKTVVAAMVMLDVAMAGKQAVLMAPTEILAVQHFNTLVKLLANHDVTLGLLTQTNQMIGSDVATKQKVVRVIAAGDIDIVVGTHALLQPEVTFSELVLAIVDEQHRFGVQQRKLLHEKSNHPSTVPHFLSMTATPIPRSLALTLYGDLDISLIREMPNNRRPVITDVVDPADRAQCYQFISEQVAEGRQVFVICPLIDPSDKLGVRSVTEEYEHLTTEVFSDISIGMLHGKLKPAEKQRVMNDFKSGTTSVLVATSVVEVGVDIPNATVMMIESAERFGLAQLHQFRGRVGRGQHQAFCFLLTEKNSQKTKARLEALVEAKDGFALAEKDLELRGPGEVFGSTQSGWPEFRLASLFDQQLVGLARQEAELILDQDPELAAVPQLKNRLQEFRKQVHFE